MEGRRSRSNSYDRHTSPRRKHKKHKHRSKRSRSRSRSREHDRSFNHRIHVNPAFGLPPTAPSQVSQMGYSASQLLQNNNFLETEVQRLKTMILEEQGRTQIQYQQNHVMSTEIRNLTAQRDNAMKQCNEVMNERRQMMESRGEMANRMNIMEVANRQLRDDIAAAERAIEGKNEEIRGLLYQSDIVQQQISGLNERNSALKAKCEATVGKNRQLLEEINAKHAFYENSRLNNQKAEADLQLAHLEIKRLLRELDSVHKLESSREDSKKAIEGALRRKEDELRVLSHKSAQEQKRAKETIDRLENRLKNEQIVVTDDFSVEAIYVTIETIKSTYEKQLSRLEEEVEALKAEKLRDHLHDVEDVQPDAQKIEELPMYLQTPQKPDPGKKISVVKPKMETILERPARCSSGPPVDSHIAWHQQKMVMFEGNSECKGDSSEMTVPLFGTTRQKGDNNVKMEVEDSISEPGTSTSTKVPSDVSKNLQIHINLISNDLSEEDLLGEPSEKISPIPNLDAIEKQLLDEV